MINTSRYAHARHSLRRVAVAGLSAAIFAMACGSAFASHMPGHETGGGKGNNPPVIDDQQFNLDENEMAGAAIGQVTVTSVKKNNAFEYAITAGNGAGLFAIDLLTGDLTATAPLDHEQTDAHILTVEATDKFGRTGAGAVTVLVGDVNEPPIAVDAVFAIVEQAPIGAVVGTILVNDPDDSTEPFGTHTFVLLPGDTSHPFQVEFSTGVITTNAGLDHETLPTVVLQVAVTDGGSVTDFASLTINILSGTLPSNVAALDGTNGFTIPGLEVFGTAGDSAAIIGDINGDGIDDFAISDSSINSGAGAAYIIFGTAQGFPVSFDLTLLDGSNGFRFEGENNGDSVGTDVNSIGDVNADGFPDIAISAAQVSNPTYNSVGRAYVVFGGQQYPAVLSAGSLTGSNGFQLVAAPEDIVLGYAVSSLGDFNNDGIDDFGISAPFSDFVGLNQPGKIYLMFGQSSPAGGEPAFDATIDLDNLTQFDGMIFHGAPDDLVGITLDPIADLNGDGFGDFTIGGPGGSTQATDSAGRVYIVFGNPSAIPPLPTEGPIVFDLATLDGLNGFIVNGLNSGDSLVGGAGGGDVNGDGRGDALLGAIGEDINGETNVGAVYVIFGTDTNTAWLAEFDLAQLNGSNGFRISGADQFGELGFPIANLSDIDGDGLQDIVAGAPVIPPLPGGGEEPPPTPLSYIYLIRGSDQPFPAVLDLKFLDETIGSRIQVPAFNTRAVGTGGDINGDGQDDLVLGSLSAVTAAGQTGAGYVIFGADF